MTSGGDDIEKLLRELDAAGAGSPSPSGGQVQPAREASPAPAKGKAAAKKDQEDDGGKGGRLAFAIGAAVVVGLIGAVLGMFLGPFLGWLPLLDFGFWSTGLGAALGAFITALVAGPPRWFSS